MSWNEAAWKRYLEGKATKEELASLEAYLRSGNLEEWTAYIAKEQQTGEPMPAATAEEVRQYLLQHMQPSRRRSFPLHLRSAAAAAAVILLVGTGLLMKWRRQAAIQETARITGWDTVATASNVIRMVTLADGTKVWLNRQAELLVSRAYPQQRQVLLKGEGYFDVTKDEEHPFSVQTGQVRTLVLGTVFNVEHTITDQAVRISLVEGKVKVIHSRDTAAAVTLLPGHTAIAGDSTAKIMAARMESPDPGAWIKGELLMNNIPLADALHKLAAYYNIRITCDPRLAKGKTVTARYHRNQPWPQVLRHMLFITQLTYTTDKNGTIHITGNKL